MADEAFSSHLATFSTRDLEDVLAIRVLAQLLSAMEAFDNGTLWRLEAMFFNGGPKTMSCILSFVGLEELVSFTRRAPPDREIGAAEWCLTEEFENHWS